MGGVASSNILESFSEGTNFDKDEIDRLRKRFMKLDTDGSGTIDKTEFLSIPGLSNNPLATRLMDVFDEDGSGTIDFKEFITGLSTFSGKTSKIDKLRFAFKIYDMDRDGFIGNGELYIVMRMMVGNNLNEIQLQEIVDRTIIENDQDGDGKLSFEEFKNAIESTNIASSLTIKSV
ncbi:protein phosphatase, calcineurin B [Scheffersomyces amazonensis]|uniref:protein phosphatase, calcineurin B n=1 Tax=Scheffersomyces amazonensis TaxID=1078765 RepID=UPI00315DE91D